MQFNKLLISLSPYQIVALCYAAQCQAEFPDTQSFPEKWEGEKHSANVNFSKLQAVF